MDHYLLRDLSQAPLLNLPGFTGNIPQKYLSLFGWTQISAFVATFWTEKNLNTYKWILQGPHSHVFYLRLPMEFGIRGTASWIDSLFCHFIWNISHWAFSPFLWDCGWRDAEAETGWQESKRRKTIEDVANEDRQSRQMDGQMETDNWLWPPLEKITQRGRVS